MNVRVSSPLFQRAVTKKQRLRLSDGYGRHMSKHAWPADLCMCVCCHVCMRACMCTCICMKKSWKKIFLYACLCMPGCFCLFLYMHICMCAYCMCVYVRVYIGVVCVYSCMHGIVCVYIFNISWVCMCVCVCVCVHVCMHMTVFYKTWCMHLRVFMGSVAQINSINNFLHDKMPGVNSNSMYACVYVCMYLPLMNPTFNVFQCTYIDICALVHIWVTVTVNRIHTATARMLFQLRAQTLQQKKNQSGRRTQPPFVCVCVCVCVCVSLCRFTHTRTGVM